MFMSPRDISLFLRSSRTDAAVMRLRSGREPHAVFDAIYADADPWASADPRYRYQSRKYDVLCSLLPRRPFGRALDVGCGLGGLASRVALLADGVLGLDVSQHAVTRATALHAGIGNLDFAQADMRDISTDHDGRYDLVTVADSIYYLPPPLGDDVLKTIATRLARLLRPGGLLLLANHYFFDGDKDSRLTRRIHSAFAWSPSLRVVSEHRRPFYLATLLEPNAPA